VREENSYLKLKGAKNFRKTTTVIFILMCFFFPNLSAHAVSPREKVKSGIDRLIVILENKAYRQSHTKEELHKRLQDAAHEEFDWEEIARRSLGLYWKKRSQDEKKEFTRLFMRLLKNTYTSKVADSYSGEKVLYDKEVINGNRALVETRIINKAGKEVFVGYRLIKKKENWYVYDIIIEGVSILKNYRVQFYSIIRQSSYTELVKKLKEKKLPGIQ